MFLSVLSKFTILCWAACRGLDTTVRPSQFNSKVEDHDIGKSPMLGWIHHEINVKIFMSKF